MAAARMLNGQAGGCCKTTPDEGNGQPAAQRSERRRREILERRVPAR